MWQTALDGWNSAANWLYDRVIAVLGYPFLPEARIFWVYLVTSVFLALWVYRQRTRKTGERLFSANAFLRFLFPSEVWGSPSAWLDVRYFFFHQILSKAITAAILVASMSYAYKLVTGGPNLIAAAVTEGTLRDSGLIIPVLYMVFVIAIADLAAYTLHYLQHKVPILWEFHKVHHSAEVMHPLSNYREHPVDNFTYGLGIGATYGVVMGLTFKTVGYLPSMPELMGVPLLLFVFNVLGYNLRHSHVWLRWPGRWSMVLPSPAHHHVHHSCHPDHLDKNFAFAFPIWDVVFGTYELPEDDRDVKFGVLGETGENNHFTTCMRIYLLPLRNAWRHLNGTAPAKAEVPGDAGDPERAPDPAAMP